MNSKSVHGLLVSLICSAMVASSAPSGRYVLAGVASGSIDGIFNGAARSGVFHAINVAPEAIQAPAVVRPVSNNNTELNPSDTEIWNRPFGYVIQTIVGTLKSASPKDPNISYWKEFELDSQGNISGRKETSQQPSSNITYIFDVFYKDTSFTEPVSAVLSVRNSQAGTFYQYNISMYGDLLNAGTCNRDQWAKGEHWVHAVGKDNLSKDMKQGLVESKRFWFSQYPDADTQTTARAGNP